MGGFDRNAKLTAYEAKSLSEIEEQFGQVGLDNAPRGKGGRSTCSSEAFLARRLILHLAKRGDLSFPISVTHGDAPDFTIQHGSQTYFLEVTEACPSAEGHRYSLEEGNSVHSDHGGGKAWEVLRQQMQYALDLKRTKPYAESGRLNLLIYPNSDASGWVGFFERGTLPPSFFCLDIAPINEAYVLWKDQIFKLSPTKIKFE